MSKTKKIVFAVTALTVIVFPMFAAAQATLGTTPPITSIEGFYGVLRDVVRVFLTVFSIVAVIFILLAAFTYLTSGGDETKVGKAKNMLIYAAIAIAVAVLSFGVTSIVEDVLSQ